MRRTVACRWLGVLLLGAGRAAVAGELPPPLSGPSLNGALASTVASSETPGLPPAAAEDRPMLVIPGVNAPGRVRARSARLPPLERRNRGGRRRTATHRTLEPRAPLVRTRTHTLGGIAATASSTDSGTSTHFPYPAPAVAIGIGRRACGDSFEAGGSTIANGFECRLDAGVASSTTGPSAPVEPLRTTASRTLLLRTRG